MGKRYLVLVLAALLVLPIAMAGNITVTLSSPSNGATETSSSVAFSCSAASPDAGGNTIASIALYTDTTGTWAQNKSAASSSLSETVAGIANGAYIWNCKATNNIGEEAFWTSNFSLTVSAVANYAPNFTGTIPNKTFNEDSSLSNAFDLDTYFQDTSALTYSSTGNSHISVSIASDGQVTFSSTANWSGSELIRFTATDTGSLTNTSNYVNVSVNATNDAPYYSAIPNQNMSKNTNHTINLGSYFSDVEGTTLTYNVSTAPSHMNYTISGSTVTLAPEPNWAGTTTISFTASDGNATTTSNTVTLNVSGNASGGRAPRLSCTPSFDRAYADSGEEKSFSITKTDPDGDSMTVSWKVGGTTVDGETGNSYTFSKDEAGTYTVAALVSDGSLESACSWTVTVAGSAEANFTSAADVESILAGDTEGAAKCGDGIKQEGETCTSCADDAKCGADELCQSGACIKKTGLKTVLIVIGIALVVLLGGGFAVYKLTMKREVKTRVRDARTLSSVDKEHPSIDVHDIYEERPRADAVPEPQQNPLKKYIDDMRKKGFSDEEIVQALKNKGWSDLMIKDALQK